MIIKERLIYQKIKDNRTPFWTLYAVNGYIRNPNPLDVFSVTEEMPEDRLIQHSVERLQSTLNMYRDNIVGGELPKFVIVMKPTPRSHGDKIFEYTFVVEGAGSENAAPVQVQQPGLSGLGAPVDLLGTYSDLWEKKVQLAAKETHLQHWEKRLQEQERQLQRERKEIEKEHSPYYRLMDKALYKVINYMAGENGSGLSGIGGDNDPNDPKAQAVEELAAYIYENFDQAGIMVINKFVTKFKEQLNLKKHEQKIPEDNPSATAGEADPAAASETAGGDRTETQ